MFDNAEQVAMETLGISEEDASTIAEAMEMVGDAAAQLGISQVRRRFDLPDREVRIKCVMHHLIDSLIYLTDVYPGPSLEVLDFYGPQLFGRAVRMELRKRVKAQKVGKRP